MLKVDKTFTAEESSDKFSSTWKVEGSDVILEGVDAEKGGEDQGGEDIGVRFDAKTFQLKSIFDGSWRVDYPLVSTIFSAASRIDFASSGG